MIGDLNPQTTSAHGEIYMNDRLSSIEKKLDFQAEQLREINKTLSEIAVQNQRITSLENTLSALWKKYDSLVDPSTGQIPQIARWQASCPRQQIKWVWVVTVPMGITLLAMAVKLLSGDV